MPATATSSMPMPGAASPTPNRRCARCSTPRRCPSSSAATTRSPWRRSPPISDEKPIHIVHLDAHFDFIDGRNGITWGHGSPMRRASEMAHVKGITTLGPHNMAAVSRKDWEAAKAYGTHIVPLRKFRAQRRRRLARAYSGWRARLCVDRHRQLRSRRSRRARRRSAMAASPTTRARTSCAKSPSASRSSASISSRCRRPTIPPASRPCSRRGPASISSARSSTNARSGAPNQAGGGRRNRHDGGNGAYRPHLSKGFGPTVDNRSPLLSLPKDKIRILLLEGVNDSAVAVDAGRRLYQRRAPAQGARRRSAAGGRQGRAYARHPLAHADHRGGARGGRPADRDRLLQRRHQPGRPRRRGAASAFRCSMRRSPTPAASPNW